MKANILLSAVAILVMGVLAVLVIQLPARLAKPAQAAHGWSAADRLDYANTLLAKGLRSEAASIFERYIEDASADRQELAKVCYRLGNIYMDLYRYEKALALYYRAEMLDKDAGFTAEMSQKIVEALENLGLNSQAHYELAKRTSLGDTSKPSGEVVARIGKRDITQAEIDRALTAVPEWKRKQAEQGEQRLAFIRDYVAAEVLYEKAKRLGIDKKAQVREALENTKKQLVIQNYLDQEIKKKLKIDPRDLENFYKANKDKYTEPAKDEQPERTKSFDEVKDQVEREYRAEKSRGIADSLVKGALEEQEVEIFYKPQPQNDKNEKSD